MSLADFLRRNLLRTLTSLPSAPMERGRPSGLGPLLSWGQDWGKAAGPRGRSGGGAQRVGCPHRRRSVGRRRGRRWRCAVRRAGRPRRGGVGDPAGPRRGRRPALGGGAAGAGAASAGGGGGRTTAGRPEVSREGVGGGASSARRSGGSTATAWPWPGVQERTRRGICSPSRIARSSASGWQRPRGSEARGGSGGAWKGSVQARTSQR